MAYYHQQCDTYFVESSDPSQYELEENTRALERHFKKQRQLALAEELSELAQDEYQDDHLRHMEVMEVCSISCISSNIQLMFL